MGRGWRGGISSTWCYTESKLLEETQLRFELWARQKDESKLSNTSEKGKRKEMKGNG